jgi:hypothetical protein
VFSFDPRCHGLCGSQKYTSILVITLVEAAIVFEGTAPVVLLTLALLLW